MQFNSYSYLLCLALAVVGFWAMPVRYRRGYVLALSCAFYATWNVYLVVLPFGICAVTWLASVAFRRCPGSTLPLTLGVIAVVGVLAFAKYRDFLLGNLEAIVPWISAHPLPAVLSIGLPLGISFYSFEAISYLLDTRQGRVPPSNFMDLALFIMFWPHLIAGPIVRSRELIPQLDFDRAFDPRFVQEGVNRVLIGLVQKNVIANGLGPWVDDGFLPRIASLNTTVDNWFLAVAFGLQIYFDFAAYSNMAIGAARLIGITLPENFRFPYHAATPAEFWSRWHMTLSRWVRDYLFFPINAGFQDRKGRLYLSLIGVMGLVGLWHGAGWGYVAWGFMHGSYLVAYRMFGGEGSRTRQWPSTLLWRGFTLAAVCAAWVPFRAGSLQQAGTMLTSMFWHPTYGMSYSVNFYLVTLLWCGFCALEPYVYDLAEKAEAWIGNGSLQRRAKSYLFRPLLYSCWLLLFLTFDDRNTQFIYFQF